jgi:hypothetical protein
MVFYGINVIVDTAAFENSSQLFLRVRGKGKKHDEYFFEVE